jgi:transcriptional regulator with XRE-family HTH domain
MVTFGEFVKNLRIKRSLTLREFCRVTNLDPSNWSKIERGVLSPPKSRPVLEGLAEALDLAQDSDEFGTLMELAVIGHIPSGLVDDTAVLSKLPVFFRTLRGEKPKRKELEELMRILKEE